MRSIKYIFFIFAAFFLFIGMNFFQSLAVENRPYNLLTSGLYPLSHPFVLKMISMGNQQTLADFYWIKLILKIGQSSEVGHYMKFHNPEHPEEHHHHGPELHFDREDTLQYYYLNHIIPGLIYNYVDGITDIDPQFGYPYHTAITFLLFNYQDYDHAEAMIDKAVRNLPDYWEFNFYKAFYLYRFKHAPDSLIIPFLERSVRAPNSLRLFHKNISLNLLIAFKKKMNDRQKQIAFLEGLLNTIEDKDLQLQIQAQIEKLLQENQ